MQVHEMLVSIQNYLPVQPIEKELSLWWQEDELYFFLSPDLVNGGFTSSGICSINNVIMY